MRRMWERTVLVAAIGLAAGGAVGCAEERAPVNRVQPNALAKSFFVGEKLNDPVDDPEFWTQGTLVDVGYGAAQDGLFTSTYAQPMSRIKWVIQEDLLIGRITYERIADSDGKGAGPATTDGVIAVVYPILGHFDIRRDYNPTTGEESNVVVENTSDRAWNEREYMRVDWSRNLNTDAYDFDTLSLVGIYGSVSYESLSYYINDPNHEDAPHFDPKTGYFDVTNKAFATPALVEIPPEWGGGYFPACYLDADLFHGTGPYGSCNPVELTIRQSFRRVVDTDFEPQDWDGFRFQAFGAFTIDRSGYTRNYGMSDSKWYRFISRYNIWERSHGYLDEAAMTGEAECFTPVSTPVGFNPHRDNNGDGTADECQTFNPETGNIDFGRPVGDQWLELGPGSQCDTFKQRCTLPFSKRKEVTQAWYYSKGSNQTFFEGTQWATQEWDVALRGAVMAARYAECQRTGGKDCAKTYPMYSGQQASNEDAVWLATEVDACRAGQMYQGEDCDALAQRLGEDRDFEPGVIALAKMQEMIVLCHSPLEATDHAACGHPDQRLPAGVTAAMCDAEYEKEADTADGDDSLLATCRAALNVRMGDLRYNQVNVMKAPQTPSPWGIYTDSEDPLTGEKVAASINVWSHVNDIFSQSQVDAARYAAKELKTSDVTEGTYIRDWAEADKAATGGQAVPRISAADRAHRIGAFVGKDAKAAAESAKIQEKALEDSGKAKALAVLKGKVRTIRGDATAFNELSIKYDQRRQMAVGTPFEAELTTEPMLQLGGVDNGQIPGDVMDYASPLRSLNPSVQREIRQRKEVALAARGACIMQEAPAPFAIGALAGVLQDKFGKFNADDDKPTQAARAERMRKYIAQRAHYAVISHEMGHSMALRHNFVSSSDAWGYRPQYWQLRTKNGTVSEPCLDATTDGESCVGPRYFDPMTEEERTQLLPLWMQSSTMDYAGEVVQDLIGIGAYDFAAARMFYGNVVSVHKDESYNANTDRSIGLLQANMDTFGGIVGYSPQIGTTSIHYSQLNKEYDLLVPGSCKEVDPTDFKPSQWNEERDGKWHAVLDGRIVSVGGKPTRCKEQPVDYVPWTYLRQPTEAELANGFYRGGPAIDGQGRTRVPYGFATDRWADVGNLSVYRHDNGADPYELFNFLVGQQEISHIFQNYRRNSQSFTVRNASMRTLTRYNEKLRDAAKGLGLLTNIYRDFALEIDLNGDDLWTYVAQRDYPENILASGIAFDHFVRNAARPQPGPHFRPGADPVLRSAEDTYATPGPTRVVIPNGATGYYRTIGYGGKPLNNALSESHGEYDSEYTAGAGAYYDKAWAAMLLTESADNFISSSRSDFLDSRFRAISLADMFPDGYRRWLGTNLTGDDELKGVRIEADAFGNPLLDVDNTDPDPDAKLYPKSAIGWTTWWTPQPEVCFPSDVSMVCSAYGKASSAPFNPKAPEFTTIIDPQVGWEQQKFLIAWTLQYLPENEQQTWLNMMHIWELGADTDPGFENRIEFHMPTGRIYVAKTFGKEVLFGKTVQKGIGARMLEYANSLLVKAYETTPGPDLDADGAPDWYIPLVSPEDGNVHVKWDKDIAGVGSGGQDLPGGKPGCNAAENYACTCAANRACVSLDRYQELPFFMRQALAAYQLGDPSMKGLYD